MRYTTAEFPDGGGVTKLVLSQRRGGDNSFLMFVGTTSGGVYAMDVRSGEVLREYRGHCAAVMDLAEIREPPLLVTAGDDKRSLVFEI